MQYADRELRPRQRFDTLDGLRGIAAAAVALGHLHHTLHNRLHLPNTGLAVDFFFILSGFVIAHAYTDRIRREGFALFLMARIVRLYPMILFGMALGFSYLLVVQGLSPELVRLGLSGALLTPTLAPNGIDPSFLPLDPPAWSLFFEMIASILFGVGLWRGGLKSLVTAVVAAAVALAVAVERYGTFDIGWSADSLPAGMARVCFGFGLGVLLYRLHRSGRVPRLPGSFGMHAALLACVLLMAPVPAVLQILSDFVLFPFIVLSAAQREPRDPRLYARLGELSYPLYIVHWPIYLWVGLALGKSWWTSPSAFFFAVVSAYAILKLYDVPLRDRMNQWLRSAVTKSRMARAL